MTAEDLWAISVFINVVGMF